MIDTLKTLLFSQRGAMFGMDARIALIVLSVLAATGGVTVMSRLERSKVDSAERGLEILRDASLDYYANIGVTEMPEALEDLFREGLVEDPTLKTDPWGNDWQYSQVTANVEVDGVEVPIKYAVIFSAGKDGVIDSSVIISEQDYAEWETANDDIGIKVASRDVELKRLEEYRARGQLIIDKITTFESARYLEAMGVCGGITPADWCSDLEGKNYTQFNYYPKSDLDDTEEVVYYSDMEEGAMTYISGDVNDMEKLMEDIGLPKPYAIDPWGRVLFYHSNLGGRDNPPFSASICYSNASSCF